MIVFKNYSRLGACMHTANHPEGDTPRDHYPLHGAHPVVLYLLIQLCCNLNLFLVYAACPNASTPLSLRLHFLAGSVGAKAGGTWIGAGAGI